MKSFEKALSEGLKASLHDQLVPKLADFIMENVNKIREDKNRTETGVSFDGSNLTDLALLESGPNARQAKKGKILQSVGQMLRRKGLKVDIKPQSLQVTW